MDLRYMRLSNLYLQQFWNVFKLSPSGFWHPIPININFSKGKVFYGQEPPSGESTTTECRVNYQLLAVIY